MDQPVPSVEKSEADTKTSYTSEIAAEDVGCSSAVQWQPKAPSFLRQHGMQAHVHCLAGPAAWNDAVNQSQNGSIDCAVEVQVVVQQQTEVKAESQPPQAAHKRRSRLKCCVISLLIIGLVATSVLVPIAVTVGFKRDVAPLYRVLQPPKQSYRLIFAFQDSELAHTAEDVLPAHLAAQVTAWTALRSSAIHVAFFADQQAMQQAVAHLATVTLLTPARTLHGTKRPGSYVLKYAVSDFSLIPDRQVAQVIDPMQLFDLAKQQRRSLLQLQQQSSPQQQPALQQADDEEEQPLSQHKQRQQHSQQKSRRIINHRSHKQQQAKHQRRLAGQNVAGHERSTVESLPTLLPMAHQQVPAHQAMDGDLHSSKSRVLMQTAETATLMPSRPQLQLQQKQAQQQVQRGSADVAWHLADAGLRLRDAWNVTSGLDRVIIAVIDSGVELVGSGIGASMWVNAAEVAGDGVDNDGNGYVDDAAGWDFGGACGDVSCSFCAPGPDPTDSVGWGTHAASTIAAQPEVAVGSSGVAPGVRVMPLKVADCRLGTQLWDVAAQQGGLITDLQASNSGNAGMTGSSRDVTPGPGDAGPSMLGSAGVQALDYAVLNGAHIVLAGWRAGDLLDGSSGQCLVGPHTAAAQGLSAAAADGGPGCVEAVQRLLFLDALQPLQEAGVLVVAASSSSGSSSELPCSLSCDLDTVLCVSASPTTMMPQQSPASHKTEVLSAAEFFAPLTSQHSSSYYNFLSSNAVGQQGSQGATGSSGDRSTMEDEGEAAENSKPYDEFSNARSRIALSCQVNSTPGSRAVTPLHAPGSDILAGWAWGSHAVVSGSSAAASVAAGAAALVWSRLALDVGTEAAPGAVEGLGRQVRLELLQHSSLHVPPSSNKEHSSTQRASVSALSAAGGTTPDTTGGNDTPDMADAAPLLDMNLVGAMQAHSTAPLAELLPAVLSADTTTACRGLRYSWHIRGDESGPYDTNAMWYVGRKALQPPAFPMQHWEFSGSNAVMELTGYIDVAAAGVHEFAASSGDKFVLWLQDWSLHMQPDNEGMQDWWMAPVNFSAPGLYKLRLIVFSPSTPFDLQWRPPGSDSFSAITSLLSLGQAQPLPQHLLHKVLLPVSTRAAVSSERSQRDAPASGTASAARSAVPSNAGSDTAHTPAADSSDPANASVPTSLPAAPGMDLDNTSPGVAGGTGDSSSTSDSQSDETSMQATMDPAEAVTSSADLQLAADADAVDDHVSSDSIYAADSWHQLRPASTPAPPGTPEYAAATAPVDGSGEDLWGALQSFLNSNWFARRLLSTPTAMLPFSQKTSHSVRREVTATLRSAPAAQGSWSRGQQVLRTPGASPAPGYLQHAHQQQRQQRGMLEDASTASSLWSRFSVALSFAERTRYKTLMPPLTKVVFTHTGALPGSGLSWGGSLQLQHVVLGYDDPEDSRGASGMVQGWLDWTDLNPLAVPSTGTEVMTWATESQGPSAMHSTNSSSSNSTNSSSSAISSGSNSASSARVTMEGSGLMSLVGGVSSSAAGVQIELSCDSCSLQLDGMTVVGSMGRVETSACITPAAVTASSHTATTGSKAADPSTDKLPSRLLHLLILFTSDDVRKSTLQVRSRPCSSLNALTGSGPWQPLAAAAAANPPAFAVASDAVDRSSPGGSGSPVFVRGMLCSVEAQPPAGSNISSAHENLRRLTYLSAERMQNVTVTVVSSQQGNSPTTSDKSGAGQPGGWDTGKASDAQGNSSTLGRSSSRSDGITVDAPVGSSTEGDGTWEVDSSPSDQMNVTSSSSNNSSDAVNLAALKAEHQRRAALTAAARAAALAGGLSVADLAPDWASSLPAATQYSFSCACFWNGSWGGDVSVGVTMPAGSSSSSSSASLSLAGWPVAAKQGGVYGPSDLDVRGYSTQTQREQLAAGSDSADTLADAVYPWLSKLTAGSSGTGVVGYIDGMADVTTKLSPSVIRTLRYVRLQHAAVGRSRSGSGSSMVLGLHPVGTVDGGSPRVIPPAARQHQLLVLHAHGLSMHDQVVVMAPGVHGMNNSSSLHMPVDGINRSSSDSSAETVSSWLPAQWDAWVPVG